MASQKHDGNSSYPESRKNAESNMGSAETDKDGNIDRDSTDGVENRRFGELFGSGPSDWKKQLFVGGVATIVGVAGLLVYGEPLLEKLIDRRTSDQTVAEIRTQFEKFRACAVGDTPPADWKRELTWRLLTDSDYPDKYGTCAAEHLPKMEKALLTLRTETVGTDIEGLSSLNELLDNAFERDQISPDQMRWKLKKFRAYRGAQPLCRNLAAIRGAVRALESSLGHSVDGETSVDCDALPGDRSRWSATTLGVIPVEVRDVPGRMRTSADRMENSIVQPDIQINNPVNFDPREETEERESDWPFSFAPVPEGSSADPAYFAHLIATLEEKPRWQQRRVPLSSIEPDRQFFRGASACLPWSSETKGRRLLRYDGNSWSMGASLPPSDPGPRQTARPVLAHVDAQGRCWMLQTYAEKLRADAETNSGAEDVSRQEAFENSDQSSKKVELLLSDSPGNVGSLGRVPGPFDVPLKLHVRESSATVLLHLQGKSDSTTKHRFRALHFPLEGDPVSTTMGIPTHEKIQLSSLSACADGATQYVVADRRHVFVTTDSGRSWRNIHTFEKKIVGTLASETRIPIACQGRRAAIVSGRGDRAMRETLHVAFCTPDGCRQSPLLTNTGSVHWALATRDDGVRVFVDLNHRAPVEPPGILLEVPWGNPNGRRLIAGYRSIGAGDYAIHEKAAVKIDGDWYVYPRAQNPSFY